MSGGILCVLSAVEILCRLFELGTQHQLFKYCKFRYSAPMQLCINDKACSLERASNMAYFATSN